MLLGLGNDVLSAMQIYFCKISVPMPSSSVSPANVPQQSSGESSSSSSQSCAQAALATEEVTAKLESAVAKAEAEVVF